MSKPRIVNAFTVHPNGDEKRQRHRSIIREFSLNTTAHGIPRIARSLSLHNCLFWSVCTVIFSSIMLYFVIQSIRAYFDYTTHTVITVAFEWPQYFPAFSICNLSPIRFDQFIEPFINYTNSRNLTNTNNTNFISSYQAGFIDEFIQFTLNNNGLLREVMYPLSSMLIQCKYNGFKCTTKDFLTFISPNYGLCYTFNAKVKNESVRYLNENGGNGKLELCLYAHSHQYVPFLTDSKGIDITERTIFVFMSIDVGMVGMIHDNTQLPLIDIAGIHFGTGQKHKLCFEKKMNFILPAPYSTCTDQVTFAMQALFNHYDKADYAYSQLLCLTICIQTYTYSQCGCVSPYQWSARSIVLSGTNTIIEAPICNKTDTCYVNAADKFMMTHDIRARICPNCQQECSSTDYPVVTSSASAPPNWLMDEIKVFVENSSIPLPNDWLTSWQTHIKNSYVAIEIVRESILIEKYTQHATMSKVDVLSNVGGQTGLWIGISFLSLMEVAELLYRLIRHQYHLFSRINTKRTVSPGIND